MSIAVYVRVSTQRQAHTHTIEQQLQRRRTHVQNQGWELAQAYLFRDEGYSGATLNRPGWDRLRDAVRAAEVDRVVLTDPERLAGNSVHQRVLLEEVERSGCQVEFLDRPMSQEPHDQLLLPIGGAVAEYERTLIAERMRRGRQMQLRAGGLLPWTVPPDGYRVDPDHPRDPAGVRLEPAAAAVVHELFARYSEANTRLLGLATQLWVLGVVSPWGHWRWTPATLRGMLTNPVYTGQVYTGRTRAPAPRIRRSAPPAIGKPTTTARPRPREAWVPVATIPAIIRSARLERVQTTLAQNQQFARRNNKAHDYLLRALVSCGGCHCSCLCRTVHPGYDYYSCRAKGNPIQVCRDTRCASRYIPAHRFDELGWQDLVEMLSAPESLAYALERAHGGHWLPQDLQARREQLRRAQGNLQHQIERLTQAYLIEVISLTE
ncbi:MAG TPA: recombinase family protein [Candidatus Competibacteraceae bacterium]|nr:recombinase family protein [Candidatus Competibacteraceae bacterium]